MNCKYLIIILLSLFLSYLLYVRYIKNNYNEKFYYNTSNDIVYSDTNGNLISVNKTSIINDTIDTILTKDFIFKRGMIIAWNGSSPPPGWALCNGQNGTPDLRGRFILSYNDQGVNENSKNQGLMIRSINQIGGSETHTLTIEEMPSHNHPISAIQWGDGVGYSGGQNDIEGKATSGYVGGGKPHNNMPPFYVLAYIMKL